MRLILVIFVGIVATVAVYFLILGLGAVAMQGLLERDERRRQRERRRQAQKAVVAQALSFDPAEGDVTDPGHVLADVAEATSHTQHLV